MNNNSHLQLLMFQLIPSYHTIYYPSNSLITISKLCASVNSLWSENRRNRAAAITGGRQNSEGFRTSSIQWWVWLSMNEFISNSFKRVQFIFRYNPLSNNIKGSLYAIKGFQTIRLIFHFNSDESCFTCMLEIDYKIERS